MRKFLVTAVVGMALVLGMAAPAAASTTGAQTFSLTVIGDGVTGAIAGTGPVQGTGKTVTIFDDYEGHGTDKVTFKKGSFVLDHIDSSFDDGRFNERTCIGRFSGAGDYTLSAGTGVYKGISGEGRYRYKGTFFGTPTEDGCSEDGLVLITVQASGTTTLP